MGQRVFLVKERRDWKWKPVLWRPTWGSGLTGELERGTGPCPVRPLPRPPSASFSLLPCAMAMGVAGCVRGKGSLRPNAGRAAAETGMRTPRPRGWKEPSQASASTPCTDEGTEAQQGGGCARLRGWGRSSDDQFPICPSLAHPKATLGTTSTGDSQVWKRSPSLSHLVLFKYFTLLCPTSCHLISWGLQELNRKKKWASLGCRRIGAGELCLPTSQHNAENSPKLQTNPQNQERGRTSPAWLGKSGLGRH